MKKISFEKSIGGIIYFEEKGMRKYLLLKYRNGHWDFVKGHQEKDETEIETLKRESLEEAGLKVEIVNGFREPIKIFYQASGNEKEEREKAGHGILISKTVYFYLCKALSQSIAISFEHIDYIWLEYEKAVEKATYKNAKELLKKAEKFLNK